MLDRPNRTIIASALVFILGFCGGYALITALSGCAALSAVREDPSLLAQELRLVAGDLRGAALVASPELADDLEVCALYLDEAARLLESGLGSQGAIASAREIVAYMIERYDGDVRVYLVLADAVLRRAEAYTEHPPVSD